MSCQFCNCNDDDDDARRTNGPAAQLREAGWPQGTGEAHYRFSVNATVVGASTGTFEADRSTRFDLSTQLRCRFQGPASLICRMCDTRAVSVDDFVFVFFKILCYYYFSLFEIIF